MFKKTISILLSVLVLVGCLGGCGDKKSVEPSVSFEESYTPEPLYAGRDIALAYNPDRGFRTHLMLYIAETKEAGKTYDKRTVFCDMSEAEMIEKIQYIIEIYFPSGNWYSSLLVNSYINLTPFHDMEEIPEEGLKIIRLYFEALRKKGVKQNLRIAYNESMALNNAYEENRIKLATECATEEIILSHINQLSPMITEYVDTMHKISCGFIGFGGEQAEVYQWPPVDYNTVIKAVVEKWCVPNNLFYSVRLPEYEYNLKKAEPDWPYFDYIGFNNDAMYGEQTNEGWHSGGFQKGNPLKSSVDWWEYAAKEAAYTPQDGEMFTDSALTAIPEPKIPTGLMIIKECFRFRYDSMSQWHTYLEARNRTQKGIMQGWIDNQVITPEMLDEAGVIYDPNWFLDANGNSVMRNPYEFLRDHLGYKIVAENITLKTEGEVVKAKMTFKNYGFAAAFNLTSGFAILDEKYNVIQSVDAGDPSKWYNRDPEDPYATEVLTHEISAEIPLSIEAGTYYIGFYLKNSAGQGAALSNNLLFEGNCNILYSFSV